MPVHIDKASRSLREDIGIDQPVIASAYLKFNPIPEEWGHLLDNAEHQGQAVEVDDARLEKLQSYATATASIFSIDSGANIAPSNIRSQMVCQEGSLELVIYFFGRLVDMFEPEIKEAIVKLYKNKKATPQQVAALVKDMMRHVRQFNEALKNATRGLYSASLRIIGNEDNLVPRTPQARLGVLLNWEKFQDSFSTAKNKDLEMNDRIKAIKRALKQLKHLTGNLQNIEDREFIYMYLSLRTRDKNLFTANEEYNKLMKEVLSIKNSLQDNISY